MKDIIKILSPGASIQLFKKWMKAKQENFLVVTLDGSHNAIKVHHITKGLVNRTLVHPRECFYPAIKDNAVSVLFAHNHPSGEVIPSSEDDDVTGRLEAAAELLGFNFLDHIILSPTGRFYSYRTDGKLKNSGMISSENIISNKLSA